MARFGRFAVATLVAALVLGACGGDDDDDAEAGGDATEAPAADTTAEDDGTDATGDVGDGGEIDGCAIVTQEDATALFGLEAKPETEGVGVADVASCVWGADTADELSGHLLQFYVWDGEQYYSDDPSVVPGAEPIDLGDGGRITVDDNDVDIMWTQEGKTVSLTYTTIVLGEKIPAASTKVDEVRALAQQTSDAV